MNVALKAFPLLPSSLTLINLFLPSVSSALVVCIKLIGPDLITAVFPFVIERLAHPKETCPALWRYNSLNVSSALVVCTKLIGPDLITAVYPLVIERLAHPKETVRKKAIMVLQRFHQLDPTREGALAGVDLDRHFRTMLCDKDPSVMSASLCALYEVIRTDPKAFKNLIPSFTSILKQVSEHRLPKTYDYHRYPAPFIQIKLLKILSILGAGDRFASENMYTVLQQALKRTSSSHTIGSALIAEYVRTITTIYPNPSLLAAARVTPGHVPTLETVYASTVVSRGTPEGQGLVVRY
eukprot:gene14265-20238_t